MSVTNLVASCGALRDNSPLKVHSGFLKGFVWWQILLRLITYIVFTAVCHCTGLDVAIGFRDKRLYLGAGFFASNLLGSEGQKKLTRFVILT